jgi:hypothetical protein
MTTDFDQWLDFVQPENYEDVYNLYQSVINCDAFGIYTVIAKGSEQWIVRAENEEESLFLASRAARDAFLNHIERLYCDGGMNIEGWFYFNHSQSKDD